VPRNNMFKIGVAGAAAAVGAILAISTVFAHSAPSTGGTSLVGGIVSAANGAASLDFSNDPVSNQITVEADEDAAEAAALAAKQAQEAAELAAKLAAQQAAEAAEAAETAETDEADNETETADVDTDQETAATTVKKTEHSDSGGDD
jgi:hypothetical protein